MKISIRFYPCQIPRHYYSSALVTTSVAASPQRHTILSMVLDDPSGAEIILAQTLCYNGLQRQISIPRARLLDQLAGEAETGGSISRFFSKYAQVHYRMGTCYVENAHLDSAKYYLLRVRHPVTVFISSFVLVFALLLLMHISWRSRCDIRGPISNNKVNLTALSCSHILRPSALDLRIAPEIMQMQMQGQKSAWHTQLLCFMTLQIVASDIFRVSLKSSFCDDHA